MARIDFDSYRERQKTPQQERPKTLKTAVKTMKANSFIIAGLAFAVILLKSKPSDQSNAIQDD